jgi:hypothetical protein
MAGDWIKMRCELGHDPDVIQIGSILGLDEFAVVGRLHAVWSWLDQHSETGTNVRIVTAYLDRLTACPGFAEAMRTVGWLSGRDGNLTFPGYETHNGETAKSRASETKRKRKQRDKRPGEDGTNVPEKPGPEKRREEKRRGEETPNPPELGSVDPNEWEDPPEEPRSKRMASFDEVVAFAKSQPMTISDECCEAFFDRMEYEGWVTKAGLPLANWQARFRAWATNWVANGGGRKSA